MISLAGRDIAHSAGKFALTGLGLGLLIGVTLTMAGVYRGMVDDAHALLNNSNADLWVVQKDTQGPYAEASSIKEDAVRSVRGMPEFHEPPMLRTSPCRYKRPQAPMFGPWWLVSKKDSQVSRVTY